MTQLLCSLLPAFWVAAAVHDSDYDDGNCLDAVEHTERKTMDQCPAGVAMDGRI